MVQDGDLFVFVHPRLNFGDPVMLLEQRGWHAELCYKDDADVAYETAPWSDNLVSHPCNRSESGNGANDRIVHVFRPEFPSMSPQQATALKRQVRVWRRVFNKHRFPQAGEQFPGSPWFLTRQILPRSPILRGLPRLSCVALQMTFPKSRK